MRVSVGELRVLLAPSFAGARVPAPTRSRGPAQLTVGICTYDDFDGAWFTIGSLLLHHRHLMDRTEILLIDNHPEGVAAGTLKALAGSVGNLRYVPVTTVRATTVKHLLFELAAGEVVVVLDSHVLLAPGALDAVLVYFTREPRSRDLVQGPLLGDDAATVSGTHFAPVWSEGMFGQWATDARGLDPAGQAFDIPMQGMGAFACRREAWPGFNPRFRGFGGEEGYLHEKIRRAGGRTVCLPALRWLHRFERPGGVPYDCTWEDQLRNYLIGWSELGWDTAEVCDHFAQQTSPELVSAVRTVVLAELAHPTARFDGALHPAPAAYDALAQTGASHQATGPSPHAVPPSPTAGLPALGAGPRTGKKGSASGMRLTRPSSSTAIPAVTHPDPDVADLLTHRRCLLYARLHGWRSVLVAETPAALAACTHDTLDAGTMTDEELTVFIPITAVDPASAASPHPHDTPSAAPSAVVGYQRGAHLRLLDILPTTPRAAARWITRNGTLRDWLEHESGKNRGCDMRSHVVSDSVEEVD